MRLARRSGVRGGGGAVIALVLTFHLGSACVLAGLGLAGTPREAASEPFGRFSSFLPSPKAAWVRGFRREQAL